MLINKFNTHFYGNNAFILGALPCRTEEEGEPARMAGGTLLGSPRGSTGSPEG